METNEDSLKRGKDLHWNMFNWFDSKLVAAVGGLSGCFAFLTWAHLGGLQAPPATIPTQKEEIVHELEPSHAPSQGNFALPPVALPFAATHLGIRWTYFGIHLVVCALLARTLSWTVGLLSCL